MIALDEDSLICDLAETYNIYDYKQLPLDKVAVFSCGLRENSRIKMKISGFKVPLDTLILASISDTSRLLYWSKSKDAKSGNNKPPSLVSAIQGSEQETKNEMTFISGKDFERARKEIIGGI